MIQDDEIAALITAMHQQIARGGDNNTQLSRLLRAVVRGLGAVSAVLTVLTEDGSPGAVVVAAVNLPALPSGTCLSLDNTVLGHVASDATARLFHGCLGLDAALEPQCGSASSVCWPLRFHSQRWGALTVHRGARAPAFSTADLARGAVITAALSAWMETARQSQQHEARSTRLIRTNRELQASNQQLMAALVCAANELKTTPAEVTRQALADAAVNADAAVSAITGSERLTWIPKAVFLQDPSR
jgi:ribosomal protein L20